MPMAVFAFAPPAVHEAHFVRVPHSSINEDNFDPFLQSPLLFGSTDDNSKDDSSIGTISTDVTINSHVGLINILEPQTDGSAAAVVSTPDNVDLEFNPLMSPHAYANSVDAGPVVDETSPIIATAN